eukprot:2163990-Alexandrium_andersonii.AAC.1
MCKRKVAPGVRSLSCVCPRMASKFEGCPNATLASKSASKQHAGAAQNLLAHASRWASESLASANFTSNTADEVSKYSTNRHHV